MVPPSLTTQLRIARLGSWCKRTVWCHLPCTRVLNERCRVGFTTLHASILTCLALRPPQKSFSFPPQNPSVPLAALLSSPPSRATDLYIWRDRTYAHNTCRHRAAEAPAEPPSPFVIPSAFGNRQSAIPILPRVSRPFRGQNRVISGSFGGRFGVVWGSIWGRFGVGLRSVFQTAKTRTPGPASTSAANTPEKSLFATCASHFRPIRPASPP